MIVLFTDYGLNGPYLGQIEAVLAEKAGTEKVLTLFADAPRTNPKASAYLLAAYNQGFPDNTIFFSIVDPGVGTDAHKPVVLRINESWYVGPDNGLFDLIARQTTQIEAWEILWRPEFLSSSFHGRDLYAPVAAMIANGIEIPGKGIKWQDQNSWPDNLQQVIYIDHFGNCMTAVKASSLDDSIKVRFEDALISSARTFSDVPYGTLFWYQNANGLMEIAVNQGSAAERLNLTIGSGFRLEQVD